MIAPFGRSMTLQSRVVSGQDAYGKDVYTVVSTALTGVPVWPAGTGTEAMQGQDVLTDVHVALLPHGTVVDATARVVLGGRTYEVTGKPFDWASPLTGTQPGVQVSLKAVSG